MVELFTTASHPKNGATQGGGMMRPINALINSGQTLTRKETAAVERYLWSEAEVVSIGDDYQHLQGAERKAKVNWYKTWSNN